MDLSPGRFIGCQEIAYFLVPVQFHLSDEPQITFTAGAFLVAETAFGFFDQLLYLFNS